MNAELKRDFLLINTAGAFGAAFFRLAFAEIFLLFVTQCLKIPKETWALVAAILPLTNVFYIASAYLTEHLGHRKLVTLGCLALARLTVPAITLLPFITGQHDQNVRLYFLAAALIVHATLSAFGNNAWGSWIADVVPEEHRGRFFTMRLVLATIVDVSVFIAAGFYIDHMGQTDPWGYAVIFGLAFVAGEADLLVHSFVADRPMPPRDKSVGMWELLAVPWQNAGFRNLMIFRTVMTFADCVVGPFAFMYLVEDLHVSAAWLTTMISALLVTNVLTYKLWQRIGERIGYRTVCSISYTMAGVGVVAWWALPAGRPGVFLAVLVLMHVWQGIAWAGINLSLSTLTWNLAPQKHRLMYFAQITVVLSVMMAFSVLCGRWLFVAAQPFINWDFYGTKITAAHLLIGLLMIVRFAGLRLLVRSVPDARSEATLPRVEWILRANPLRLFPVILTLDPPVSPQELAGHADAIRDLMPEDGQEDLESALAHVLKDPIHEEDEFYSIVGRERIHKGKGLDRMLDEIVGLGDEHVRPARVRAAANRIRRLYEAGEWAACLRTVRRLAHHTGDRLNSPMAKSALSVIDALAARPADTAVPREEAALLAVYGYLQIIREPADRRSKDENFEIDTDGP